MAEGEGYDDGEGAEGDMEEQYITEEGGQLSPTMKRPSIVRARPRRLMGNPKPRRFKVQSIVSRTFHIPRFPRDKNGFPKLPIECGMITVHNLGVVKKGENFITERYIYPVGFEITR